MPIRRAAAMLVSHGFMVAVQEIYHELEPFGTVLACDEAGAERGNRHKTTKVLSSYDGDARSAGLSQVLTALHRQAGRHGNMHWGTFGVSRGDAA